MVNISMALGTWDRNVAAAGRAQADAQAAWQIREVGSDFFAFVR
jgi:hypothetical protein